MGRLSPLGKIWRLLHGVGRVSALILVQGPMDDVVTLDRAKSALRVDTTADDVRIRQLVDAATQRLDGAEGILGRALMPQTWRLDVQAFPGAQVVGDLDDLTVSREFSGLAQHVVGYIEIPLPPLISVSLVQYLDTDANLQTLSSSVYRVIDGGRTRRSRLVLAASQSWPSTRTGEPDAIRITFNCGYRDLQSPANTGVPEAIVEAILMLAQSMYDRPGQEDVPEVVHSLLAPYKMGWFGGVNG